MNAIVNHALKALLYEAVTWPKPGLVDPIDAGSHTDMDIYLFISSSLSLTSYLKRAARLGQTSTKNLPNIFGQLRAAGQKAEKTMFATTGGVNTHKGAIFSLGIFVCAESYAQYNHSNIYVVIRQMCRNLVKNDLEKNNLGRTAGEREYLKYGLGGVRQVAQDGYPIVENIALPFLQKQKQATNWRLLDTLMKIAQYSEDSNLIKRAGNKEVITALHRACQKYFSLGASKTVAGRTYLSHLNTEFKQKNYSLGGCADLLIVTIFMALEKGYLK